MLAPARISRSVSLVVLALGLGVVVDGCDGCTPQPPPLAAHGTADDIDGDGVRNGVDEDIDGDGIDNDADPDVDGDGVNNADDPTPFGEGADQTGAQGDLDGDGVPNVLDDDDDNDGVPDGVAGVGSCDGTSIAQDENSDCDGYCISVESGLSPCDDGAPAGSGQPDSDGDGIPDATDPDDDGDGIPDASDPDGNGLDPGGPGVGEGEGEGEGEPAHPGDCASGEFGANCNLLSGCTVDYPYDSSTPETSIDFNESDVLKAMTVVGSGAQAQVRVYYNDEHALMLGIRRVTVTSSSGDTSTDYAVSAMPDPSAAASAFDPDVGTTAVPPDEQAGTDPEGRPTYPSLFVTDVTDDPLRCTEGHEAGCHDWQFGGTAIPPHAVFGSWKAGVRTLDTTASPPEASTANDDDPDKNHFDLDQGDPVTGLDDEGFGSELRWDVNRLGLTAGHTYRLYVMVHDGDHDADVGQACGVAEF